MGAWLDGYTHITDNSFSGGGTYVGLPWRVVWHTIEGGLSESLARNHNSPPHLWVAPPRNVKIQTVPLDRSSYAMWDQASYPVRTNKGNAIQIEIEGYAAKAGAWPDSTLRWLAREVLVPIVEFIHSQGGTFDFDAGPDPANDEQISGSSAENAPQRFGWEKWRSFNSACGHRHVTGNGERYDPGLLDLRTINRYAREILDGSGGTSTLKGLLDYMATNDEVWALLIRTQTRLDYMADQIDALVHLTAGTSSMSDVVRYLNARGDATGDQVAANTGKLNHIQESVDALESGGTGGEGVSDERLQAAVKAVLSSGARITFG